MIIWIWPSIKIGTLKSGIGQQSRQIQSISRGARDDNFK